MSPKTLYQVLQVDPQAAPEVIEVAYRRLARMYHPDLNGSPDASRNMQEINDAYRILRNPEQRALYDLALSAEQRRARTTATAPPPGSQSTQHRPTSETARPASDSGPVPRYKPWDYFDLPTIPCCCEKCGKSDSTLRIVAFPYAISVVIVTLRRAWGGLYCRDCRRSEMAKAKLITFLFGWWGIPWGPIYSLGCLFESREGRVPAELNAPYLAKLGVYFLKWGQIHEGVAALEASLGFQQDSRVAELHRAAAREDPDSLDSVRSAREAQIRRDENRSVTIFFVAAAILVGLVWFMLEVISPSRQGSSDRQANAPTTISTDVDPTKTQSPLVAVPTAPATRAPRPSPTPTRAMTASVVGERTVLYSGPSRRYPIATRLDQSQMLTVLGQQGDCKWLQVRTGDGEEGWVTVSEKGVATDAPCEGVPLGTYRPETGHLKRSTDREALGELEVDNSTGRDALVIVVDTSEDAIASAYIRDGDTYTLNRISDGVYRVYFALGRDWDGSKFTSLATHSKFDERLEFETTEDQYTGWTIGLQPIVGGNAETSRVPEKSFPAFE